MSKTEKKPNMSEAIEAKINEYLARTYAMWKLVGAPLDVWSDRIHPDGRCRKPIVRYLEAEGFIEKLAGTSSTSFGTGYVATSKAYDAIVTSAPDCAELLGERQLHMHLFLENLPAENLKHVAENRDEYLVAYIRDTFSLVNQGVYFEINPAVVGKSVDEARKAYVDHYNLNPYDLKPIAISRSVLAEKVEEARRELVEETLIANIVTHLVEKNVITKEESEHVRVKSRRSRGGVIALGDSRYIGLSDNPDNWSDDVDDVIVNCDAEIARIQAKRAAYVKLQNANLKDITTDLRNECVISVAKYLKGKEEDE